MASGLPHMEQPGASTSWDDVVAGEERWTKHVLLYLDDWDPEPPDMPAQRASAFAELGRMLDRYVAEHQETARTIFRRALHADIHRRFVQRHGHDSEDGPIGLYEECKRHARLESSEWAGEPLSDVLERRLAELTSLSEQVDPDPDVMTSQGTNDVFTLVTRRDVNVFTLALGEQRRAVIALLSSDPHP